MVKEIKKYGNNCYIFPTMSYTFFLVLESRPIDLDSVSSSKLLFYFDKPREVCRWTRSKSRSSSVFRI